MNRIGIDMVHLPEFKNRMGQAEMERVFTEEELRDNPRIESLAGLFAAKEAFFKALGRPVDWKDIRIEKDTQGRPHLHSPHLSDQHEADVSISHEGEYAIAAVVVFKRQES